MVRSPLAKRLYKACLAPFTRPLILASSLVMLSMSVLFMADLLGLRAESGEVSRDSRKVLVEALAVQLSTLASNGEAVELQTTVTRFVLRNGDIHSAALVRDTGVVLAQVGDTTLFDESASASTATQLRVPIFDENRSWGEVRVVFAPASNQWIEMVSFAFIALSSLVAFTAFLNRALVQLDPKRAVPGRVDSAMNLFSAGVLVLDEKLRIVMANQSAANIANRVSEELTGRLLDDWAWRKKDAWQAPWRTTLNSGLAISDERLVLESAVEDEDERAFLVSCAFVGGDDDDDGRKGVLVTLDEMTTVERQNRELTGMVVKLRRSQEVINEKNRELKVLATTDPLTGIVNRRTLMWELDEHLQRAGAEGTPLSCIMTDIDHFKQVNDNYGHAVGDDVIRATAEVMQGLCRDEDIVGRYGGEEFVIVLPGMDATAAAAVAERARIAVIALAYGDRLAVPKLSSSFGVADLSCGAEDGTALVDAADQGLYRAKERGRNQVVIHDPNAAAPITPESLAPTSAKEEATVPSAADHSQARVVELEALLRQRDHELSVISEFDALTGMPLRSIFLQRVDAELMRAARDENLVGVIALAIRDLDRLVSTFGYALCDELVLAVVDRLQNGLRSTDVVSMLSTEHSLSRITSNEYGLLLSSLSNTTSALIVVTRLKRLFSEPFLLGKEKVYVGAAIGIALSSGGEQEAASLFAEASEACQAALLKSDKVAHLFASGRLHAASDDYIRLESDLHEALDRNAIETWFQPKFDLARRRVTGMEALLRWKHETRGYVPPPLFVAVAEANGLIDRLSQRVLEATLQQIVVWRSMGFDDLRVSINISPMQLKAETLVEDTLEALEAAGVEGRQLEIELTETTVLDSPAQARQALSRLREAGVGISIDDFGTGYTSLSLLADLPLDVVKIDRVFVEAVESNARSRAVVGSVISMAHALDLRVVGEGVETNAQLEIMEQLGCDDVQGYLISRPQPADKITAFLVEQRVNEQVKRA